jgi:competence protein ComEC
MKKFRLGVFMLLAGILIFTGRNLYQNLRNENKKEILVLHSSGRQALVFIKGRSGILFTDMPQKMSSGNWENEILPLRRYFRLEILDIKYLPKKESVIIRWEGKQIYYLNSKAITADKQKAGKTDLIIVSNNITVPIPILFDQNPCPIWVADGTNSLWKIQEWKKEAEQLHLRFHSVSESGAFRQTF